MKVKRNIKPGQLRVWNSQQTPIMMVLRFAPHGWECITLDETLASHVFSVTHLELYSDWITDA